MTIQVRPEVLGVLESPLVQIATAAEAMPGSIKLCYGESDTPTPEFICRAAAMAQQAGIVALREGEPYVRELRARYARCRALTMEALATLPGVTLPEPQGAFYAFPRIDGLADSASFCARLLSETGLAVAPGAAFGPAGEGHVRLCFAATEATLGEALRRFRQFMSSRGA